MTAALAIAAAAGLAALGAARRSKQGSRSEPDMGGLQLGANDLPWVFIDIGPARTEYPGLPWKYQDHLALVEIETKQRGRFWEAMRLVEDYARKHGYPGVVLRAEAQSSRVDQETLEGLYRRAGYRELPSGVVDGYDDEDVFFVKDAHA
jgi:hypothetical protein